MKRSVLPSLHASLGGALAFAALALFGGCLVFNGKIAQDEVDSGTPANPDAAEGPLRDAAQGFCASQRGSEPIVCLDFDDVASPSGAFPPGQVTVAGAGRLSLDAPEGGPPPPSLPHALDILIPGTDGGSSTASAYVSFGPLTKGIDCKFYALYDQEPGWPSSQIMSFSLTGRYINSLVVLIGGQGTLISGFVQTDGGQVTVYAPNSYSYQWTADKWVPVDVTIDLATHTLSVTIDGQSWGDNTTFRDLGPVGGGRVELGWSGSPMYPVQTHIDNVVCNTL